MFAEESPELRSARSAIAAQARTLSGGRLRVSMQSGSPRVDPAFVRLSSERVRQAVPQDCSFAERQASPPALLVVVPLSGVDLALDALAWTQVQRRGRDSPSARDGRPAVELKPGGCRRADPGETRPEGRRDSVAKALVMT
jgi:hypothetical protein